MTHVYSQHRRHSSDTESVVVCTDLEIGIVCRCIIYYNELAQYEDQENGLCADGSIDSHISIDSNSIYIKCFLPETR